MYTIFIICDFFFFLFCLNFFYKGYKAWPLAIENLNNLLLVGKIHLFYFKHLEVKFSTYTSLYKRIFFSLKIKLITETLQKLHLNECSVFIIVTKCPHLSFCDNHLWSSCLISVTSFRLIHCSWEAKRKLRFLKSEQLDNTNFHRAPPPPQTWTQFISFRPQVNISAKRLMRSGLKPPSSNLTFCVQWIK